VGWIIASAVVGIVLFDLVVRIFYVRLILPRFENKPPFNAATHPVDPETEPVQTVTRDGVTLRGGFYRSPELEPRGLVLFCPELGGDHATAGWYCDALLQAGFDVLSFDFRGQGDSDSVANYAPIHWPTQYELTDLRAMIDFIEIRDDLRELPLCLMGISRGSLTGLIAAAQEPRIRAVIGEGTYTIDALMQHFTLKWAELYVSPWVLRFIPRWHYRITLTLVRWTSEARRKVRYAHAESVLPRLGNRPVLLIAGERDNYVPPTVTQGIARRIGSHCAVWTAPEAKHNQARDAAREEYDRRIVEFFSAVCPAPHSAEPVPSVA
jgi:pimeloyl-ACP methyl ester carboxylesterase